MFVVDNMKTNQRGEEPGNQLEFHVDLRKLFTSAEREVKDSRDSGMYQSGLF